MIANFVRKCLMIEYRILMLCFKPCEVTMTSVQKDFLEKEQDTVYEHCLSFTEKKTKNTVFN